MSEVLDSADEEFRRTGTLSAHMIRGLLGEAKSQRRLIEKLQWICRVLEDRIKLIVTVAMDNEIDDDLDGHSDSARWWESFVNMVLSDDDSARYRQAKIRAHSLAKQASAKVREWLRGILRTHGARIGKEGDDE